MKALQLGDKGLRVRLLQQRLKRAEPGFDPGPADGTYGTKTLRAVKAFEAFHGIKADGIADAKVLRRLQVGRAVKRFRKRRATKDQILPRSKWKAAPARGSIGSVVAGPRSTMFDHCTVTNGPGPDVTLEEEAAHMRLLQQIAFGRGFFDISYSFVTFASGRVWEARGWFKAGAHTEGFNSTAYATAGATACSGEKVSGAMVNGFATVGRIGVRIGALIKDVVVRNHNEVAAKSCPGAFISERREAIQKAIRTDKDVAA